MCHCKTLGDTQFVHLLQESWPYIMMMLSMKYKWGVNEWIKYGAELRKKFVELEAELEEKLKTKMKPDKVAAIRAAANYRVDTKG